MCSIAVNYKNKDLPQKKRRDHKEEYKKLLSRSMRPFAVNKKSKDSPQKKHKEEYEKVSFTFYASFRGE